MWDRKIPFEVLKQRLLEQYNIAITRWYSAKRRKNLSKQIIYLAVSLFQLFNGLRASEAVRAFKSWIIHRKNEFEVEISKRKDGATRIVITPSVIKATAPILEKSLDLVGLENITTDRYKKWFLNFFDINTHTLRKAFESYLARNLNKDLVLITAFQGRKSVESHLAYLRKEEAKEEIRKLLKDVF